MSKITNDGLTRSDTGCFIAVPVWASKGFKKEACFGHVSGMLSYRECTPVRQ